jgi:hypothetical protein
MPIHPPRSGIELRLLLDRTIRQDARRREREHLRRTNGRSVEAAPSPLEGEGWGGGSSYRGRLWGEHKQNRNDGSESRDAAALAPDVGQHYRTLSFSQGTPVRQRSVCSAGDNLIPESP